MQKINYLFDRAFLDLQYTKTFTELCKKNGVISKDINGSSVSYDGIPLRGVKKLLQHLVMFENIDFSYSLYDYSQLIDRRIISEKSICTSDIDPDTSYNTAAVQIMSAYKSDIIKQNIQMYKDDLSSLQSSYNPTRKFWKERDYRSINIICIKKDFYLDVKEDYYKIIQNLDTLNDIGFKNNYEKFFHNIFYGDALLNLTVIRDHLAYALQAMESSNSVYISSNLNHLQGKKIKNNLDNVYALVQSSLPNEVNIVPMPTTLKDVWNMRNHPAISTFRNVMSEWNYYVQSEDFNAAQKIKKDIIKANHQFEKLEKYKKLSSSPYMRTGLFVAGFIPVLSNIVNVYSYAEPHLFNYLEKKFSWTHINDCKNPSKKDRL